MLLLNCVAELRKAKDTADFFDGMGVEEQRAWMDDMLAHAVWPAADAPHVCLIDPGVNRGHPMLAPLLEWTDQHTVNLAWGVDDTANHGTGLAGLATYGELIAAMEQVVPVTVTHRLECVCEARFRRGRQRR
ncbi:MULTISPECIES: S8 family serine peptidase [Burkholderia]|uniref:S8 family serine peptidase n=1 Tax=Burkholderia TaxID=32008 RepID=UPI001ABB19D4|nr:S8 family serine peptidase [Burkholderia ambifaria]